MEITACLKGWNSSIQKSLIHVGPTKDMSNQDQGLENLCSRCGKVAQELLLVLGGMRAKSSRDKWRTFRQALVAVWQEDRIGQLQKRLLQLRQQIEAHITISLRCD